MRSRLTNLMSKREVLYGERTDDAQRNAAADEFIAEERFGEALEFLEITKDESRLEQVERAGIERGDTFLMLRIEKIRGQPTPQETWKKAAASATAQGRFYDAYRALNRAGDEESAEAIRSEHMPDFAPMKPEGK